MKLQTVSNSIRRMMACVAFTAYATISKGIKGQTRNQAEIAVLQNAIGAEYTMMKNWESKYNSYLKTAQGYGTSLKASMAIYSDETRKVPLPLSR